MTTLNEKFVRVCLDFSDREAMRVKSQSGWSVYKYKDLLLNARKVAAWLSKNGFPKGTKAAIILDNSPQWSMVYFGVLLAGGISIPLDPQASRQDIITFVEDAGADLIFLENRLLDGLQHHLRMAKQIIVLRHDKTMAHCLSLDDIFATPDTLHIGFFANVAEEDTASILYSSGTTSNPKGVELSHKNLFANFEGIERVNVCNASDNFISILPLFHAYAFMATLVYPLFIGAKIVYPKTIKSSELVQIIKDTGITIVVGVPELFHNIHKSLMEKINELSLTSKLLLKIAANICWNVRRFTGLNLSKLLYFSIHERFGSRLRYLVSGGARLDPKVAFDLEKFGFAVIEGYGLTETSPIVSLNPPSRIKIGSVGRPLSNVSVKIMNPNAQGIGEIAICGSNVMKGYYQKSEETNQVIKEGWFYSGDLGFQDRDGYLHISGRLKEVIVLGSGKNIFPDEIEKYYAKSQYIKEVGTFLTEEAVGGLRAVIVPNLEIFKKSGQINIEEKIRWDVENISKELASYKRIMGFVISKEELPKTRLGKIKRYQLPLIYTQEAIRAKPQNISDKPKETDEFAENPLGRQITQFLKKELSFERDIRFLDHLELDLGIDSLMRVELVAGLEKLFRIRLSDDVLAEVATVEDLIAKVDQVLKKDFAEEFVDKTERESWKDILHFKLDEKQFETIDLNPQASYRTLDYVMKKVFFVTFKIFFRLKIINRENLPSQGPYIICCNHASYLDAFVVVAGLSNEVAFNTYFIGLKDIFEHPLIRWTTRLARVIPIDPTTELIKAMQAASFVLRHNKILCIFPEGQRSIDGEVKRFKKGVGILVKELGVNIVPVAIAGSHAAWGRTVKLPKPHPIKIIFGKPLDYQSLSSPAVKSTENEYKLIADRIREEIIRLQNTIRP